MCSNIKFRRYSDRIQNDKKPKYIISNAINPIDIMPNDINPNDIIPNDMSLNDIIPNNINPKDIMPNEILYCSYLHLDLSVDKLFVKHVCFIYCFLFKKMSEPLIPSFGERWE